MYRPLTTRMLIVTSMIMCLASSSGFIRAEVISDDGKKHGRDLNLAVRKLIRLKMNATEHQHKARAIETNSREVLPGHETMDMSALVQEVEEVKKLVELLVSKLSDMQSDEADTKIEQASTSLAEAAKKINKKKRELMTKVRSSIGKRVVVTKPTPVAKPLPASRTKTKRAKK